MGDLLVRTHKDLEIWNLAMNLAEQVYGLSSNFPKNEAFGLVQQMRRSAVSVPSNIAEGAARQSTKEFIQISLYIYGFSFRARDAAYAFSKTSLCIR